MVDHVRPAGLHPWGRSRLQEASDAFRKACEEAGLHPGCTDASDLVFTDYTKLAYARARLPHPLPKKGPETGITATTAEDFNQIRTSKIEGSDKAYVPLLSIQSADAAPLEPAKVQGDKWGLDDFGRNQD